MRRIVRVRMLVPFAVAALFAVALFAAPASARSTQEPLYPLPENAPAAQNLPAPEVVVSPAHVEAKATSTLPVTGGDIAGIVLIAVVLIGAGVVMVRLQHARRASN